MLRAGPWCLGQALSREIGDRRAETDSLIVLATIDLRGGDAAPAPQAP